MNTLILIKKIDSLPNYLKNEVNDFIDFLLNKQKNRKIQQKSENKLLQFAGIWSNEEANEITRIINDNCNNI